MPIRVGFFTISNEKIAKTIGDYLAKNKGEFISFFHAKYPGTVFSDKNPLHIGELILWVEAKEGITIPFNGE